MDKGQSSPKISGRRWQALRNVEVVLPEPAAPASLPVPSTPMQPDDTVTINYPLLRVWLRDRYLPFKPIFDQRDVALILGKSDKTVRSRTRKKQIPCHRWPWGEVYYTPQDLEYLLASCASDTEGCQ